MLGQNDTFTAQRTYSDKNQWTNVLILGLPFLNLATAPQGKNNRRKSGEHFSNFNPNQFKNKQRFMPNRPPSPHHAPFRTCRKPIRICGTLFLIQKISQKSHKQKMRNNAPSNQSIPHYKYLRPILFENKSMTSPLILYCSSIYP